MITDQYLNQLKEIFVKHGVVLAYLFGSQAEGKTRPSSDVDVAVLLPPATPRKRYFDVRLALTNELMSALNKNNVDVVVLNEASGLLAREVVRSGRILYEDGETRPSVDFVVRAMKYYADTEHFRKISQTYLLERIELRRPRRLTATLREGKP